jgi:hypothetical protein
MSLVKKMLTLLVSAALLILCAGTHIVQAALGGFTDSIATDRKALSAEMGAVTTGNRYAIHEIVSGSTTVREYISLSGVVFGIAWNGLVHPDLTQLLGSYAAEYQGALAQRQMPRGSSRRHLQLKTDNIVVEKWGHMRNLQGRAYVPSLIPEGVSSDEIK